MNLINEGLPQKGIVSSEIESSLDGGHIKITARTVKPRNKKPIEQDVYFTLNGLNVLIGNLQMQANLLKEEQK